MKSYFKIFISGVMVAALSIINFANAPAYAEENNFYGFGVSPMTEKIILNPGDTYKGSFTVTNPARNTGSITYAVSLSPFYATEDYDITYEDTGDYNQIVSWITLQNTNGTLAPNEINNVNFTINVPTDAPAGGQYAAIIVKTAASEDENGESEDTGVKISQAMAIAHTIFAEVTGTTVHSGDIVSTNLPGFMFDGKITGSSTIENIGNVHGTATYKLQIFPLFSSEEAYTNEEDPDTSTILPNRTRYHETVWNETPMMGIFNAIYTVEYEGMTEQVSRLIIICPLWLIFIILLAIVAIVVWLVIRIKMRKKAAEE
ncbi:hypothetical protein IJI79_02965 [Candidatus Saccharibacteria bacterium]|nr:hypothetical protein [Candidatus Saccharibacteria bacterium]